MLSSVLRSARAVEVNIAIMRTFVQLRRLMDTNRDLARKIGKRCHTLHAIAPVEPRHHPDARDHSHPLGQV